MRPSFERVYLRQLSQTDNKWHSVSFTHDEMRVSFMIPNISYFRDRDHTFTWMSQRLLELYTMVVFQHIIFPTSVTYID